MGDLIIDRTDRFRLVSHGNGAAYTLENLESGDSLFVQYGDDAEAFRSAYDSMCDAYANSDSVWHSQTWDACLAYLFENA